MAKKKQQLADGTEKKVTKIKTKKIQKNKISTIQEKVTKQKI